MTGIEIIGTIAIYLLICMCAVTTGEAARQGKWYHFMMAFGVACLALGMLIVLLREG